MRYLRFLLVVALAVGVSGPVSEARAGDAKPLTVVELFTSQGCSSCPPADRLLGELATRPDVLALSIHVDYWDYIGWKDPFARPSNSDRQRDYAAQFSLRYVYTPQMVVDGAFQGVGSNTGEVKGLITRAQGHPRVTPRLERKGAGLELSLPESRLSQPVEIVAVYFDRSHETKIKRGENSGRNLTYSNVLRKIVPLALWKGDAKRMAVAAPKGGDQGELCAVILQRKSDRRIIGAARLETTGS